MENLSMEKAIKALKPATPKKHGNEILNNIICTNNNASVCDGSYLIELQNVVSTDFIFCPYYPAFNFEIKTEINEKYQFTAKFISFKDDNGKTVKQYVPNFEQIKPDNSYNVFYKEIETKILPKKHTVKIQDGFYHTDVLNVIIATARRLKIKNLKLSLNSSKHGKGVYVAVFEADNFYALCMPFVNQSGEPADLRF